VQELKKKEMEELDAVFAQLGIQADNNGKDSSAGGAGGDKKKKKKDKKKDEDASGPGDESVSPTRGQPAAAPAAAQEQEGDAGEDDQDSGPVDPAAVSEGGRSTTSMSLCWSRTHTLVVLPCSSDMQHQLHWFTYTGCCSGFGDGSHLPLLHALHLQAKARLLAAKKKGDAKKKPSLSGAALAEAQARKAKLSKQKDTKAYNQMPSR
jgi:hypothetical protein